MICARLPSQAAFCATRLLYHVRFDLSRGFWKVFQKFFAVLSNQPSTSRRKCPIIISHLLDFVKRFFKSFSTFFVIFFREAPFQKRPAIISHLLDFVKGFFKSFSNFFHALSWSLGACPVPCLRASRSVLAYYSTSLPVCQEVFVNFFAFGSLGSLAWFCRRFVVQFRQYACRLDRFCGGETQRNARSRVFPSIDFGHFSYNRSCKLITSKPSRRAYAYV